ncbi:uncharacterized protein JCM6883_006915 [Sporobolomyces salmoneus]|uniref:uncharacterized protein n=1 Tax=Sporobolomyces salmoneus TaxID=183962 RepID=UPI0031715CD6
MTSLRLRTPRTLPFLAAAALQRARSVDAAIIGAQAFNISSDSTQLTYVGTWRSDQEDGIYQAYSNASDAAVTFSFIGVGVAYLAEKKADRGLCQLAVDGKDYYTVDLYNDSGYSQGTQLVWDSGTLVYGAHNVTISQLGPDARFGYYPYLITETWIESVPTNVAAYTATQARPSPTSTNSSDSSNHHTSPGPIIGGVIGGVLAAFLLGFLFYLWRRDKAQRRRSEGAPVQKVKKAEGKFAIEDEQPFSGAPDLGGAGGQGGLGESGWAGMPIGAAALGSGGGYHYQDPYGGGGGYGATPYRSNSGSDESYHNYGQPRPSSYGSGPAPAPPPPGPSYGGSYSSPSPYQYPSSNGYETAGGGTMSSQNRSYPYHEQGYGTESRRYPVPEI